MAPDYFAHKKRKKREQTLLAFFLLLIFIASNSIKEEKWLVYQNFWVPVYCISSSPLGNV
jgi:hypothetical protein